MLRRSVSVLLLLLLSLQPLFSLDITIPESEYLSMKGQLYLLLGNLTLQKGELTDLRNLSERQDQKILSLQTESESLEKRIKSLLDQSEVSEKEMKEISKSWETLSADMTATIRQQKTTIKILNVGMVAAFIGGCAAGYKLKGFID